MIFIIIRVNDCRSHLSALGSGQVPSCWTTVQSSAHCGYLSGMRLQICRQRRPDGMMICAMCETGGSKELLDFFTHIAWCDVASPDTRLRSSRVIIGFAWDEGFFFCCCFFYYYFFYANV